jgi:hypothetical protein
MDSRIVEFPRYTLVMPDDPTRFVAVDLRRIGAVADIDGQFTEIMLDVGGKVAVGMRYETVLQIWRDGGY